MSSEPALTPKAAAHLENMIERTERRGAILTDLVDVCVTLSKKLARDMLDGPFHPESRHDTARAFDVVTRSLRLTLAMEERVDARLFALHNGEVPVDALKVAPRKDAGGTPAVQEAAVDRPSEAEASESERRESETERLVEYDRFDLTDINANVEAIQAKIERLPPPSPEVGRTRGFRPRAGWGMGATPGVSANNPRRRSPTVRLPPTPLPPFGGSRPSPLRRREEIRDSTPPRSIPGLLPLTPPPQLSPHPKVARHPRAAGDPRRRGKL
jgi:hypothetical protein